MIRLFLSLFVVSALFQWFMPWWTIVVSTILITYLLAKSRKQAIAVSFSVLFIQWGVLALWMDINNSSILSSRIAAMLGADQISGVLFLVSALLGGLVAAISAYVGFTLKEFIQPVSLPSSHYEH